MKSFERELFTIYLLVDLLILNGCFVVFHLYRLDAFPNVFPEHLMYFLHFNVSWILAYYMFSGKSTFLKKGFSNRIFRITKKLLIYIVIAFMTSLPFFVEYSAHHFFVEFVAFFYLTTIWAYFLIYKYLKHKRKKGLNTIRAVIISTGEKASHLRRVLENNPALGYKFLGFIVRDGEEIDQDVLGTMQNLEELICKYQINMVFSIPGKDDLTYNQLLISKCDKYGLRLRFVMDHNHPFKLQQNFATDSEIELLNPHKTPRDYVGARIQKRVFDIIFSSCFILFVFSWCLPIVALIIKFNSKGPVFFRQKRTGFNNKIFSCLKFRTMRPNYLSDIKQATVNDNRVTSVGQFLRSSHIDEFPQIINVFLGQMSVIGPRPHMLKHTEQYSELIKLYLIRHYVKPGITGWAQINGYVGETDELWKMEKRVEYDMFYVDNWSLLWDFKIIWRTIFKGKRIKMESTKSDILLPVLKESSRTENVRNVSDSVLSEI